MKTVLAVLYESLAYPGFGVLAPSGITSLCDICKLVSTNRISTHIFPGYSDLAPHMQV